MDFFQTINLAVPLSQVALVLALSTLALLFGRMMMALSLNYAFFLYWGYVFNRKLLFDSDLAKIDCFNTVYFGFGLTIVMLAMIGFLVNGKYK